MLTVSDETVLQAIADFTTKAVVVILDGRLGRGTSRASNGSGLLLRTPENRTVLLTARHVLEDEPPVDGWTLGQVSTASVGDAIREPRFHDTADVALAELSVEAAQRFQPFALSVDMVAKFSDGEIDAGDLLFLCGCPFDHRETKVDPQSRVVTHEVPHYCVRETFEGTCWKLGHERHQVRWGGHVMGTGRGLQKPHGISGGPLFRYRKPPPDGIWSPSLTLRVVGVASTYREPIEFCPAVSVWGEWFEEQLRNVDRKFPSS